MSEQLPSLPLFVDDYEAATAHLTIEEDGAYMRLLRLCWRTPRCSIPDDADWIMRRMRVDRTTYDRLIVPIIAEFFRRARGRIYQKRLLQEFDYAVSAKRAKSEAGKRGGIAKARKNNGNLSSNATDLPEAKGWQNASPQPQPHSNPPTPLPDSGKVYAFEGRTVKLNQRDFDQWAQSYHAIADLRAELQGLDDWLHGPKSDNAKRRDWFRIVSRSLGRKHDERVAAKQDEDKARAAFEARNPPQRLPESEWRAILGDGEFERRKGTLLIDGPQPQGAN